MFAAKDTTQSASSAIASKGENAFIQPKLNVGKPDDRYEVEADNAADQIVAKSNKNNEPSTHFFSPTPTIQKAADQGVQQLTVAPEAVTKKDTSENTTIGAKNTAESDVAIKEEESKEDQQKKEGNETAVENKSAESTPSIENQTNTDTATTADTTKTPATPQPASNSAEKTEDSKEEDKEDVEKETAKEASIPKAPTRPEDDPAFKAQIKKSDEVKTEKSQHPDPTSKVGEQKAAGHASPASQTKKSNQEAHSESLNAVSEKKREPFTPEGFKEMLKKNLDDLENQLPKNSDEAKEFRDDKPIDGIKENISGQVTSESDKLAGPMKQEADKPAPDVGTLPVEATPLPAADPGTTPKPLDAKASIPKPKTSQEISMEKESQSLDDYMADNEIKDEQLAISNEPKFTGALEEKNNAQKEAKLAPINYRKKEKAQLSKAQKTAAVDSQQGLDQMQAAKLLSENSVLQNQTTNKDSDKTEKEKIYAEFEKIYNDTKKTVTDSLEKLSDDVDKKFSNEAESAQKTFEKNVEDGLGDIYGWTVVDDWLFGEDTEAIERLFRKEKSKFVSKMDTVLDDISVIISDGLNAALDAIAEGKRLSKEKFDSLDESQKKLAEDAYTDFNDQYAELEDTVYEKQEELAQGLAKSYKENVDSLREKFDEIKEKVSAGWIGAALNALAGVVKAIMKIKDLLLGLLSAAVSAIGAIISDPIGFLSNLISGIKQGFENFGKNIKKNIIQGLIEWLTGSLGNVGIQMPDNLFSLSGIFSLVTQMLGLTWDYFRSMAVKLLGEPIVAGMEKAVEIFTIVKDKGVEGLWDYIKEQFSNLKEMVMDAIRDMVITKVIEAGIKWVLGLMSPAGAFVKAAMMIIDIVKFFVERAAQIFELVQAFIDSIKALAAGNVSAVAKGIEKALTKAIPVLIGFLASLVGITGLTGKVQKIIKKVRKKVDKAMKKIILKAKKLFGKGKKGKKVAKDDIKNKGKNENEDKKGELKEIKKKLSKDIKKELKKGYGAKSLKKKLSVWKKKYKLKKLQLKGKTLLLKLNPEDQLNEIDSIKLGKLLMPILAKAEQEYIELFIDGEEDARKKIDAKKEQMRTGNANLLEDSPDINQQVLRESNLVKPDDKKRGRTDVGEGTTVSHQTSGNFATYKVENIGEYKDLVNIGQSIADFFDGKKVTGVTSGYLNNAIKGILSTGNPASRKFKKAQLIQFLKDKEFNRNDGTKNNHRKGILNKIGVYERTLNRLIVLVQELEPIRQDGMAATTAMQHRVGSENPDGTIQDQLSPDGKHAPMTPKGASMKPQEKEATKRQTDREDATEKRFERTGNIFKDFAKMAGKVEVFIPEGSDHDLKPLEKWLREWVKLKLDFDSIPETDPQLAKKAQAEIDKAERIFKDEVMLMMVDYNGRM